MKNSSTPAIQLTNCSKRYKYLMAVHNVNLKINKNEIIGIIGPNGAGKTTLLNIIAGVVRPDQKSKIHYQGRDLSNDRTELKNLISLFSYHSFLYDDLTGLENLEFWIRLYNNSEENKKDISNLKEKIIESASKYGMKNWLNRPINELSTGMRKKIEFLRILLVKPEIVLLDEPFSGLDPNNINFLIEIIKEIQNTSCTICIVSHNLSVLSKVCERILVLKKGKLTNILNIADIKQSNKEPELELKRYFDNNQEK